MNILVLLAQKKTSTPFVLITISQNFRNLDIVRMWTVQLLAKFVQDMECAIEMVPVFAKTTGLGTDANTCALGMNISVIAQETGLAPTILPSRRVHIASVTGG